MNRPPAIREDHPNPAWARPTWRSLDGTWDISRRGRRSSIRVPFPVGSPASGVEFHDRGRFIYRRSFELPDYSIDRHYLLHVGACDYRAAVLVNGVEVGRHTGGYASFSFDISGAARAGHNSLEIRVRDSHSPYQVRGKQTFLPKPFAVWYAGISGIWQSVWIEETGARYIARSSVRADFAARKLNALVELSPEDVHGFAEPSPQGERGDAGPQTLSKLRLALDIAAPDGTAFTFEAPPVAPGADRFSFSIPLAVLGDQRWSPERPQLYAIRYRLFDGGRELDTVDSYFGLRALSIDQRGVSINGKPVYLRMVLDQGYYPGGVYTPERADTMERDIRAMREMGFNGARIHEKVESPYFHYLCDKLGLLTTFEMPSFYLASKRGFAAYRRELEELIARDAVHPSCIIRMLFNETWGIWRIYARRSATRRFVLEMVDLCRKLDPDRPVIDNSGWEHLRTDIVDVHHYLKTSAAARSFYARIAARDPDTLTRVSTRAVIAFYLQNLIATTTRALFLDQPEPQRDAPLFLSEYGGFGWYDAGEGGSAIENIERYTADILESGLFCGYCYTQFCDTGSEVNGLLTADRVPKVDTAHLAALNAKKPQTALAQGLFRG